jgi:hypothetical protein
MWRTDAEGLLGVHGSALDEPGLFCDCRSGWPLSAGGNGNVHSRRNPMVVRWGKWASVCA